MIGSKYYKTDATRREQFLCPFPPDLFARVEDAANEEHRPVADVVRELVETGLGERLWKAHTENEFRLAREIGLPDDDQPMTDEYRQTLCAVKSAQGLASAREGKLVDG